MRKLILVLALLFSGSAFAQNVDGHLCGVFSQMSTNRSDDLQKIEKELSVELEKKSAGQGDETKILELTEKTESLRYELRQLDIELNSTCN